MIDTAAKARDRAKAQSLMDRFVATGARPVETAMLQPADLLLDLYGEDIRARAYVTSDPLRGEMMLRPDFTVPIARAHIADGAGAARYTYAGEVFRKQEQDETRAIEYLQTGIEIIGGDNAARDDADLFGLIASALSGQPVTPVIADMSLLRAAVAGLATTDARRAALMRHIWRPHRFRRLLDRFTGKLPLPPGREKLLASADPLAGRDIPGLRRPSEITERLATLREDAATPPISSGEADLLQAVMGLRETAPNVLAQLRDLSVDMPALAPATETLAQRLDALSDLGVAVDGLEFDAAFGRSSMEYYDGFVFAFHHKDRPDLQPLATGGRYDALMTALGAADLAAIGAVIRPDQMEDAT